MANLFIYKDRAAYQAATNRPASESSVSYDGSSVIGDGVNVILPFKRGNAELGDMVIFDTVENKKKILKWKTYHAASFDSARYILSNAQYFDHKAGVGLWAANRDASVLTPNGNKWAEKCYFRLTGFDLTANGSITFNTYYAWGAHNGNEVTWNAGATLASIAASMNGLGLNASYFKASVLADGTGIGVWVDYPTTSTIASIFSITAQSGSVAVQYMNKYNGNDVVWQYVETASIIPGRIPAQNIKRKNGLVASWCGGHLAKFIDYYGTNGSATFVEESNATPMNRACWNSLASSAVEAEINLYNKYGGDYTKYMEAACAADPCNAYILNTSYDDILEQTRLLSEVMTQDYDMNSIPAFPAAYNAYKFGIAAGVVTGFEPGKWALPGVWDIKHLIEKVGLNSSNKTDFNKAIDKCNPSGNFYGSGYYFWTFAEISANDAWGYVGNNGRLANGSKVNSISSRPVLALLFED